MDQERHPPARPGQGPRQRHHPQGVEGLRRRLPGPREPAEEQADSLAQPGQRRVQLDQVLPQDRLAGGQLPEELQECQVARDI